ncbi:MAG TPA: hypothetical protein VK195_21565, partial [Burkholderiaceae bacterium]|nr:hypothetical protein [Burkholderiaceae bacterium]
MSTEPSDMQLHHAVWDSLPWLVNGTADEAQQSRALRHLEVCETCRDEYLLQQRLHEGFQRPAAGPGRAQGKGPDMEAGWARLE